MVDRANAAVFLQGLTGTQPLIIIMFLAVHGAALDLADMRSLTGRSPDSLQPALDALCLKGWVVKQIGQHGKPSYLPGRSSFFDLLGVDGLFLPGQIPEKPESAVKELLTTTTTIEEDVVGAVKVIKNLKPDSGIPGICIEKSAAEIEFEAVSQAWAKFVKDNEAACDLVGIGNPKRRSISQLDWVTPDFIITHVNDLVEGETVGLAIRRIEGNELPRSWAEEAFGSSSVSARPKVRRRGPGKDPAEKMEMRAFRSFEAGLQRSLEQDSDLPEW